MVVSLIFVLEGSMSKKSHGWCWYKVKDCNLQDFQDDKTVSSMLDGIQNLIYAWSRGVCIKYKI